MNLEGFNGRCHSCGDSVGLPELDVINTSFGKAYICFYCIEGFYYDGCRDKFDIISKLEKVLAKNQIPEVKDKARKTAKPAIDLEEIMDFHWSLTKGDFWKKIEEI